MARLTFLWHLHQPQYRTADGRVHAPWVLLHAGGEYLSLCHALERTGATGHVLNLTPVFVEQLRAYRDGTARDPLLAALRTPASELGPEAQQEILRWAFLLHPNQLRRWPRLRELAGRAAGATPQDLQRRFTRQDFTDLQVLVVLAYAEPNFPFEPEVAALGTHHSGWSSSAAAEAGAWLAACPEKLLEAYARLQHQDGIEISTSPLAHPIMPLLLGTEIVDRSWAPHPAPQVPDFAAPADATRHLTAGLSLMAEAGFRTAGCWPPEGAVSEAAVQLYGDNGVQWLVADEGILAKSLGRAVSGEHGTGRELMRSWRLAEGGPVLFFRHRGLSDFIGFHASRFPDEADAARQLTASMRRLAHHAPPDGGIVLALDGENPWTSFPQGGIRFLLTLTEELRGNRELEPVTLAQRAREEFPESLPRLHPGSWIGGTFATWIGHPEKNRAWELLAEVRARGGDRGGLPWLWAQGSDWWWWFGDDNPTLLAPLYDEIFRLHLRDACLLAGVAIPAGLAAPIRAEAVSVPVPSTRAWNRPVLDGNTTSFFEWAVAAWLHAPAHHLHLARAAIRVDDQRLWLRVDPRPGSGSPDPVTVHVMDGLNRRSWTLPEELPNDCAAGSILEASLPRPGNGALLALEFRGERLPPEGFWKLEFVDVDEPVS